MSQQITVGGSNISLAYDPNTGATSVSAVGENGASTFELAPFTMYAHQIPLFQAGILEWLTLYRTNHPDNSAPTKEEIAQLVAMGFIILGTPQPAPQPQSPVTTTAPNFSITATF